MQQRIRSEPALWHDADYTRIILVERMSQSLLPDLTEILSSSSVAPNMSRAMFAAYATDSDGTRWLAGFEEFVRHNTTPQGIWESDCTGKDGARAAWGRLVSELTRQKWHEFGSSGGGKWWASEFWRTPVPSYTFVVSSLGHAQKMCEDGAVYDEILSRRADPKAAKLLDAIDGCGGRYGYSIDQIEKEKNWRHRFYVTVYVPEEEFLRWERERREVQERPRMSTFCGMETEEDRQRRQLNEEWSRRVADLRADVERRSKDEGWTEERKRWEFRTLYRQQYRRFWPSHDGAFC